MKKLFALFLTVVLCLCSLSSCGGKYEENTWFSQEKLSQCLVSDLPTVKKDYITHNDKDIYVNFNANEYEAYVNEMYEYLMSQNFKYLGTRGSIATSLAGAFTTYYFEYATELSEFLYGSTYRFVYSDGTLDDSGKPIFCIILISKTENKKIVYDKNKEFTYNTVISLRYKSEAPFAGFYTEHEHTYEYLISEEGHLKQYTCGCPLTDEIEEHCDNYKNGICDICGYKMTTQQDTKE